MPEPDRPHSLASPEAMVEWTLSRVGRRVVLGAPLGLGKPNQLVNAFYRRAEQDPSISLVIYTALSLAPPTWANDLERRLVAPMVARLWGDYPRLAWLEPMRQGALPGNVEVREFYFSPGTMLRSPAAQQSYVSTNYSHVVRDVLAAGLNVLAQAVAAEEVDGEPRYSLSCNSDLSVDLLPRLRASQRAGHAAVALAQVNPRLPFMYGDAMVPPDAFDGTIELAQALFGTPNLPIDTTDYLIALHVSTLVRDGGTLQLGIGALGDAVVGMLQMRHEDNASYRHVLADCGVLARSAELIDRWGGMAPFARGLYAASEMLIDGFLDLWRHGILKRRVYPHATLQRLLDDGRLAEEVSAETLAALVDAGAVAARLGGGDVELLRRLGVLRAEVRLAGDELVAGERTAAADLSTAAARDAVAGAGLLGERLRGGRLVHSCFFLGPQAFYQALRDLPRAERELIEMTGISFVNELYGDEELKRAQRRHARFVNTGLMATLTGAVVSDGLEDGRVVSGVGGQYNFVAMAHELDEGRSILMIRSTREHEGETRSNVVWSYGHATIPRHLRDLVVTEYGIADLRGKTDAEVIAAMLEVADSRFQEELLEEARRAGKIAADHRLPDRCRQNTPERLERQLAPYRERGLFAELPYGTDLTAEEVTLAKALRRLKGRVKKRDLSLLPDLHEIQQIVSVPAAARPYLERLELAEPEGLQETLLQKAVVFALISDGVL